LGRGGKGQRGPKNEKGNRSWVGTPGLMGEDFDGEKESEKMGVEDKEAGREKLSSGDLSL